MIFKHFLNSRLFEVDVHLFLEAARERHLCDFFTESCTTSLLCCIFNEVDQVGSISILFLYFIIILSEVNKYLKFVSDFRNVVRNFTNLLSLAIKMWRPDNSGRTQDYRERMHRFARKCFGFAQRRRHEPVVVEGVVGTLRQHQVEGKFVRSCARRSSLFKVLLFARKTVHFLSIKFFKGDLLDRWISNSQPNVTLICYVADA